MEKLYRFKDLSETAKERAINDYITFLVEVTEFEKLHHNSNLYKACKIAEEMRTPWFIGEYIWDYCKKSILKDLNHDFFTADGKFVPNTTNLPKEA